ncbi:MAG TPA: DNA polymerase I, partial [Sporichthyaceae bacterium]
MNAGRLLLLDGHSLAYRAFFALPVENFSTTTGAPTNAVYGFTSMLINTLRDEKPTHMAVCFDVSRATFRSEAFPEYKANRTSTPDDFRPQVSLIREVLDALRVPVLAVEGYEADDVIATLAVAAENTGYEVLILSGDRDAFQLVSDHVTVLYPVRGVSELSRMDPAAVQARYDLTPTQYPDFAALRGDPSDNLPSVPGVGEKTAAKWIREFGSLAELTARVDELKGKTGDSLRAHLSAVLLNRQLTELRRDVPLDLGPDDLKLRPWDRDEVHAVFDTLQFRVLRERLWATLESVEPEAEAGFEVSGSVLGPDEVASWLAEHAAGPARTGVDVAGTWGRGTGNITGLALAAEDGAACWVDPAGLNPDDDAALADWLADETRPKALHDAKGPMLALAARGWPLAGLTSDTALSAYLALPGQRSFELSDLALRFLHRELRNDTADEGQLSFDGGDEEANAQAAMVRARAVIDLAAYLDNDLADKGGAALLAQVELPLVEVLAQLEQTGIGADADYLAHLSAQFGAEVKNAEQAAFAALGHEVNLGSPKQLQVVLFEDLGLPKTKKIKTGYTTDAESLLDLYEKTEHPFLEHLLRHRDVTRLKSTVDGLLPMLDAGSRIHTTFNQMIAATGRLSSVDPNLQNIPIRTEEGRRIRTAFVAGAGYEALLT